MGTVDQREGEGVSNFEMAQDIWRQYYEQQKKNTMYSSLFK